MWIVQEQGRLFNKEMGGGGGGHNGEHLKVIVKRHTQPLVLNQLLLVTLRM